MVWEIRLCDRRRHARAQRAQAAMRKGRRIRPWTARHGRVNADSVGVPEDVWDFQIGGYEVCHMGLYDRTARRGYQAAHSRKATPSTASESYSAPRGGSTNA